MHQFRRPGRRHAALSFLAGITASAVLLGCQRFAPVSMTMPGVPATDTFQPAPYVAPAVEQQGGDAADLSLQRLDVPDVDWLPTATPTADELERMDLAGPQPEPESAPPAEAAPLVPDTGTLVETGVASTYGEGDGFQGNRTACGQRFDTKVPQAAHKTLPCGTTVRIEDSATGRSVTVEVTDRGPYVPGRVVDLSWAAYSELHDDGPDLLNVNVYVVGQS